MLGDVQIQIKMIEIFNIQACFSVFLQNWNRPYTNLSLSLSLTAVLPFVPSDGKFQN